MSHLFEPTTRIPSHLGDQSMATIFVDHTPTMALIEILGLPANTAALNLCMLGRGILIATYSTADDLTPKQIEITQQHLESFAEYILKPGSWKN